MKISFVGDINLGEYYLSFGHGPKTYAKNEYVFEGVQSVFDRADIVVGNLEAPITSYDLLVNDPESLVLRADPLDVNQLKRAGVTILNVANNHIVQHGEVGFRETIKLLDENNISVIGINNESPTFIKNDGLCYGFLAASDVPDNTDTEQVQYQRLNDDFMLKVKQSIGDVDHLIVYLHWGLESSTRALPYQKKIADELYEFGVSVVVGCHPHLFYEIDCRDNFVCAYSLGNFVFDLSWDKRMHKTGILEVDFNGVNVEGSLWPAMIDKYNCLPIVTGSSRRLAGVYTPYDLGTSMKFQQIKKIIYFIRNINKGQTLIKLKFIFRKILVFLEH